ncbi:MAG: phosphoribosyltransferase family protein [Candidatus Uhrbacteria bacterium]|nr:phosphoribosyltransferase family protein [bacterium]MCR4313901.1 phosphoribosyltransferase family protein [Candidatus Uhrbacteria bacterium]
MERHSNLKKLKEAFLEIAFPVFCISCHQYPRVQGTGETGTGWVCGECIEKIEMLTTRPPAEICSELDGFIGVGYYHDPILRKALHELKYHSSTALLPSFQNVLRRYADLRNQPWPWVGETNIAIQPLVGVPRRIRARGFDQAEFFTNIIRNTWIPWAEPVSILKRHKKSVSRQADLEPGPLRIANVKGVYEIKNKNGETPIPQSLILVDDVVTTGATMQEATRILREAGVKKVFGIAIAVGK